MDLQQPKLSRTKLFSGRDKELLEMWHDLLQSIEEIELPIATPRYKAGRPNKNVFVEEQNGTISITAEMAGMDRKQVDVEVSNRSVTIKAESEKLQKNFTWDRTFDYEIDPNSVKATMVIGILDMTIEKKSKTSAIKV